MWQPDFPFAPRRSPIFYGWVVVLISTLGILFSIPGQTMGFSVFTEILMEELGLTRVQLSAAYFVGTVGSGFTLPMLGSLLDRLGARKMFVASAIATGVILFYLSSTAAISVSLGGMFPDGWQTGVSFVLICIGFYLIRGAAQGVLTMTSRNAVGKWFNLRRGIALSVSSLFVTFAFGVAPRVLDDLIERFGYQGAWMLLGVLTICFMAPVGWLFLRDNPEECGLTMDGPMKVKPQKENLDMKIEREFARGEALRTLSFWTFNLTFAWYALYSTAFTFHIVSLERDYGLKEDILVDMFLPLAAISVVTNVFFGLINSRTRLKYLLIIMNIAACTGAIGLWKLDAEWGKHAYVIGNGITGGAFVSLMGIVWPRFFGRKHLGAIAGVNMSTVVIASGIGPVLFGACRQWAGSYEPILLASVFIPATLMLLSFWADNPQRK